jgi:hypothetical protein
LKKRKPSGTPWPEYVRETFGIGRERADQLIRIADGRTTVEKVRADGATRAARNIAKLKSGVTNAGAASASAEDSHATEAHQIVDAGLPADAVKAAADRAATKPPKPAPDVAPAADRAEPNATAKATKPEEIRMEQMVESSARPPAKFREALDQIVSAEATPEAFWAEAARELVFWGHANVAAVTLLDSAIQKLAAIKARQPEDAA